MSERRNLTITQVEEIKKVGDKQIPKLSFRAREGDNELAAIYFTFKSSLFELIKEGQTISADVEISTRKWEDQTYTDRRIVQIYLDGQPVAGKKDFYRGKSPEELDQTAKSMALSYAKDLAVAKLISLEEITKWADTFYTWVKKNGNEPTGAVKKAQAKISSPAVKASETDTDVSKQAIAEAWEKISKESPMPNGKKVQNIAELKSLLMKHKIATHEAKVILSIKEFDELTDLDKAWEDIKKAKGLEP